MSQVNGYEFKFEFEFHLRTNWYDCQRYRFDIDLAKSLAKSEIKLHKLLVYFSICWKIVASGDKINKCMLCHD